MMYYEKGRFRLGCVSFALPDGIFIDPEFEMEIENGFELVDPDGRFRVSILGENCDESSLAFLEALPIDSFHRLTEVQEISINGVSGHKVAYYSGCRSYLELRFDLPKRDGVNCLCVIMKCKKGVLHSEAMESERIFAELVNSIKLV